MHAISAPIASCRDLSYPATEKVAVEETLHGTTLCDDYRWLEEPSERTSQWLAQQQQVTLQHLAHAPHLRWLTQRLDALWRYDDSTPPSPCMEGERLFFSRKNKEQERRVYYTQKTKNDEAQVFLDPNSWPKEKFLDLLSTSRDGRYVAYGVAEGGNENPEIRIIDLETGKELPDRLQGWKVRSISWCPENAGFFYSANPLKAAVPDGEEHYWNSAYYHKLGTSASEDERVFYSENDKTHYHSAYVTEDKRYEVFYCSKNKRNEVSFRPFGSKQPPTKLATGFEGSYSVEFYKDQIYILTDEKADMKQLFVTSIDKPDRSNWTVVIPEKEKSKITQFKIIDGRLYVNRLENAYTRLEIYDLEGKFLRNISLPGIGSASFSGYQEIRPEARISYASFFHPTETFEYHFATDTLTSIHRTPINVDTSRYETKQVFVRSKDGTDVSMFLLANKEVVLDGSNPTYLTGYGGFQNSATPHFSNTYLLWLEAGGVVAIPNLRGGGEYGRSWHEAGIKEKKQNVFDDFIASAEYLISEKYSSPSKLAIQGGSNGGLLVGAVMTQRPELFRAVLCAVPLLDMIHYHKWGLAKIWEGEYGTSDTFEAFQYLLKYSPYHNVKDGTHYPATLITVGENDARVNPCHARKMIARLQEANSSSNPILLYSQESTGHSGAATLTERITHHALQHAFLMSQLSVRVPSINSSPQNQ